MDYGCKKTNTFCGENMIYMTIYRKLAIHPPIWQKICMQICICMKRNKLKKNGRCIGKEIVSHKNKIQVKLKN